MLLLLLLLAMGPPVMRLRTMMMLTMTMMPVGPASARANARSASRGRWFQHQAPRLRLFFFCLVAAAAAGTGRHRGTHGFAFIFRRTGGRLPRPAVSVSSRDIYGVVPLEVPSSSSSSSSSSPQPPFLQRPTRGSPSRFLSTPSTTSLRVRALGASSVPSEESPPPPPSSEVQVKFSTSRSALRHVLEDVCRFREGSAVLTAFRRGDFSDIDELCNLTDDDVSDLVLQEKSGGGGGGTGTAATPTLRQKVEITKIKKLKRWREHLRRQRGGIAPRDDDWLELTSDDFRQFSGLPLSDQDNVEALTPPGPGRLAFEAAARAAQAFVESITAQQPLPIPGSDGMFVMKDVVKLERGTKIWRSDLVIRKITRPFWQACIDAAETPDVQCRVCAVGTSGIGKTASTAYLIRMLLLERKKTVVYHVRTVRNSGWVFEFIPGSEGGASVTANVYSERTWDVTIPSFRDPSTYYVVDPGDTDDTCNPPVLFLPKVIIVTSPDSKHWGGTTFFKARDDVRGVLKVYPLWELDELLQARPYLGRNVSVAEVKERYFDVGGVPGHVFASGTFYDDIVDRQTLAANALSVEQVANLAYAQRASVNTFDASQPTSALLGLQVADDDDDDGTFSRYTVKVIADRAVSRRSKRDWERYT
jgi:hypothetical protein